MKYIKLFEGTEPINENSEKMTVAKLIEMLKKCPQDAEHVFYEKGASYDTKIIGVKPRSKFDLERNQITLY